MATPSLPQALSHHQQANQIAADAVTVVKRLMHQGAPIPDMLGVVAAHQVAAAQSSSETVAGFAAAEQALTDAHAFSGVSSYGFPISEPLIALIDAFVPAPAEAVPDTWWVENEIARFLPFVEQLVESEVQDAGRTASQTEFVARPEWTNYVRMLTPPSCDRCTILAGRIYRDLEAFQRHPRCDCVMVPVDSWESAHDRGLITSPMEAFDKGQVTGLSKADTQAIRDGADITAVVNAKSGITTADVFGKRVKATTQGTTRRAAWRRANPTRLVRLRPESIYQFATDREDAIRLLRLYGYIK